MIDIQDKLFYDSYNKRGWGFKISSSSVLNYIELTNKFHFDKYEFVEEDVRKEIESRFKYRTAFDNFIKISLGHIA